MQKKTVFLRLVVLFCSLFILSCTPEEPLAGKAVELPSEETEPIPLQQAEATFPVDKPPVRAVQPPPPVPVPELSTEVLPKRDISTIKPLLTYPNAYNGPLYDTGAQIGDSAPLEKYTDALKRNGVAVVLGFFSIEPDPVMGLPPENEAWSYLHNALKNYPGQFVPFLSTGLPAEEVKPYLGDVLTEMYRKMLDSAPRMVGEGTITGIGEIEQYAWPIDADDSEMTTLVELAQKRKIAFMFHPPRGNVEAVRRLVEGYPSVTFLIHMFPEDISSDRSGYIDLLEAHDNLYYGIDADHTMFDGQSRLLYKYEDLPVAEARDRFITDFDQHYQQYLSIAVARYKPLVEAAPDKVMWGTELGTDYGYEPEVYDRMIKYSRLFIAQLPTEHQEAVAYQNAVRVFGEGEILEK